MRRGLGTVCANPSACAGLFNPTAAIPDPTSQNSWMVAIGNRLTAANTQYQQQNPGALEGGLNLTLAQSFAAAGLTDAEAECWMSIEPSYLPELIEYNLAMGCGAPSVAPGASPLGTNYATAAPALAASNAAIAAANPPIGAIVTSTPGASPGAATPVPVSAGCSFALFGDTSCIGGVIGSTTALVLGAAALALLLFFGGKK